jgi:hypothetical protein
LNPQDPGPISGAYLDSFVALGSLVATACKSVASEHTVVLLYETS